MNTKRILLLLFVATFFTMFVAYGETVEGDDFTIEINETWIKMDPEDGSRDLVYKDSKTENGVIMVTVLYESGQGDFRNFSEFDFMKVEGMLQDAFGQADANSEVEFRTINGTKYLYFNMLDEESSIELGVYTHIMNDYLYQIIYIIDASLPEQVKELEDMINSFQLEEQPLTVEVPLSAKVAEISYASDDKPSFSFLPIFIGLAIGLFYKYVIKPNKK